MPGVTGRKPKDETERRNRVAPRHDWLEVQDVPFTGCPRKMPAHLSPGAREWWKSVSTMPHCVTWNRSDWQFFVDTLVLVIAYHNGNLEKASEIRIREARMGTTFDTRRDLRIRYIQALPEEEQQGITALDDYKSRIRG